MENTFLILNNGLTILLLQAKGSSGALFRKKISSLTFFFLFIREKHNVLFKSSQCLTTSQVIILCVKMFNGGNITYITGLESYLHIMYN